MKNNFSNSIRTLQIHDYVIRVHERLDNLSRIHQRCVMKTFEQCCHDIFEQYSDLFENVNETRITHQNSARLFKKTKFTSQIKKMQISQKKVVYLKYVINKTRIFIKSIKLNVIKKWNKLTNVKKVRNFIDFVNYNRKFIKEFSQIAKSFTKFTKDDVALQWKKVEKKVFYNLKKACFQKSILKMFDLTKSKRREFDASDLTIKACYNQCHEKNWHFITYFSRKLSSIKQNYDVHDKK